MTVKLITTKLVIIKLDNMVRVIALIIVKERGI